jgi:hypothetical protein
MKFSKNDIIFIKIEIPATKTYILISEIEIAYVSNLAHALVGVIDFQPRHLADRFLTK